MLAALAALYIVAGYWYFWQVLMLMDSNGSEPGTRVLCAALGLLTGPLLMLAALCAWVPIWVRKCQSKMKA